MAHMVRKTYSPQQIINKPNGDCPTFSHFYALLALTSSIAHFRHIVRFTRQETSDPNPAAFSGLPNPFPHLESLIRVGCPYDSPELKGSSGRNIQNLHYYAII